MSPENRTPENPNPSEQSHSKLPAHPDSDPSLNLVNPGESTPGESTPGVNLGRGETNPNQPQQDERKPNRNIFSSGELGLYELLTRPKGYPENDAGLKEYLATLGTSTNLKSSEINAGFISKLSASESLTKFIVEIVYNPKAVVSKIENSKFPYETKANSLKQIISLMVGLISKTDLEFRGRKPGEYTDEEYTDHSNNALWPALKSAVYALVDEAAKAGPQELADAISALLKMTKGLPPDGLRSMYNEISTKISTMGENGVIDNGLKEQINRRINQDTEIDQDTE